MELKKFILIIFIFNLINNFCMEQTSIPPKAKVMTVGKIDKQEKQKTRCCCHVNEAGGYYIPCLAKCFQIFENKTKNCEQEYCCNDKRCCFCGPRYWVRTLR